MNLWEAIILGFVQGLTEFLPVSSSAHLRVVGELIGSADPGAAFTAITQIGTELAVLIYFRKDIVRIITAWWRALVGRYGSSLRARLGNPVAGPRDADALLGWYIILGTIPIVVLALGFQDYIEHALRNLWITAAVLAIFAVFLGLADRFGRKRASLDTLTTKHAVAFGLGQAMALVPGVSRSGGTITVGLLLGYTREAAARYSFLLAIPAVLGSGAYQVYKALSGEGIAATTFPGWGVTAAATVVAFVVGYFVIIGFLKLVSTKSYWPFVFYRIFAAAVIVVLLATSVLDPLSGVSP